MIARGPYGRKAPDVPTATVSYYPAGSHCTTATPGDLVLVRHDSIPAKVIRFGERLRLRKATRGWARVNHAASILVGGPDASIQEQVGRGGVATPLWDYVDVVYAVVHVCGLDEETRERAAAVATWYLGVRYGWGSIIADALYLLTGIPLSLAIGQSVVCSADAAAVQRVLGLIPDKPDVAVLPSDLARYYGVVVPLPTRKGRGGQL